MLDNIGDNSLNGFRVAVIASDGFEEAELIEPVNALKKAGAQVDIISVESGKIRAFRHQEPSIEVDVDQVIGEVKADDYNGLVLPGGALNADFLRAEEKVLNFVKQFDEAQKPIAAICHAPWILISAGLAGDRMITSYHTIKDDLKNAGARWVDQVVVLDRNWVTSRSPADLAAFNRETIKLFSKSANPSVVHVAESA